MAYRAARTMGRQGATVSGIGKGRDYLSGTLSGLFLTTCLHFPGFAGWSHPANAGSFGHDVTACNNPARQGEQIGLRGFLASA